MRFHHVASWAVTTMLLSKITNAFHTPRARILARQAMSSLVAHHHTPTVPCSRILSFQHPRPSLGQRPSLSLYSTLSSDATVSTSSEASMDSLLGMEWIQDCVVQVLNQEFDYQQVARTVALAKLEPKKKKKKKKKKNPQQDQEAGGEVPEVTLSAEEKEKIANKAAEEATPFARADSMVTAATKLEFGDYQCNAAMSLARNVNMSPRYVMSQKSGTERGKR